MTTCTLTAPRPRTTRVVASELHCSTRTSPIRLALVQRVRTQIAAGSYETPHKIEVVLDRLAGVLV